SPAARFRAAQASSARTRDRTGRRDLGVDPDLACQIQRFVDVSRLPSVCLEGNPCSSPLGRSRPVDRNYELDTGCRMKSWLEHLGFTTKTKIRSCDYLYNARFSRKTSRV